MKKHPPGQLRLRFDFPAAYGNQVKGSFLDSSDLSAWEELPDAKFNRGSFVFNVGVTSAQRFFRAKVSL